MPPKKPPYNVPARPVVPVKPGAKTPVAPVPPKATAPKLPLKDSMARRLQK